MLTVFLLIGGIYIGPISDAQCRPTALSDREYTFACIRNPPRPMEAFCHDLMARLGANRWVDGKYYVTPFVGLNHHLGPQVECLPASLPRP